MYLPLCRIFGRSIHFSTARCENSFPKLLPYLTTIFNTSIEPYLNYLCSQVRKKWKFYFWGIWAPNVYFTKVKFMDLFIVTWFKLGVTTHPILFWKRILIILLLSETFKNFFLFLGVMGPEKLLPKNSIFYIT